MLDILGKDHPTTKTVFENMADCYQQSGADISKFDTWLKENLTELVQENKKRDTCE